jgi:RNA polymerase sigma-70 factor, ECF subfamily
MPATDAELIHRARSGDFTAFEELIHRHDRQVLALASHYVTSSDDAKDIYQEVFIRVFKALPRFQFRSEFATWLFRITTNVCITFLRTQKRHRATSFDDREEGEGDQGTIIDREAIPDEQLEQTEIAQHVEAALQRLAPQQRIVFTLRHYEGYKLHEIAGMMQCSEGTVKRYLHLATRKMRNHLRNIFD